MLEVDARACSTLTLKAPYIEDVVEHARTKQSAFALGLENTLPPS